MRLIAENLGIDRGGRRIVSGVSFDLTNGALMVSGANGAGKSTLLRAIAGLLPLAEGRVRMEDAGEAAAPFHYIGHRDGLKPQLTARENLAFAADFLSAVKTGRGDSLAALTAFGMQAAADSPVAYLSAGQRRRVALARLLVAPRPLWLLDEPATALDKGSQEVLARLLAAHVGGGGLVVAASHSPLGLETRELRLGPAVVADVTA